MKQHIARAIFMVEPTSFGFDEETAATNAFQHKPKDTPRHIAAKAQQEFDVFVACLRRNDIHVVTFRDAPSPAKPDALFPNNWLSTWGDGRIFLYPMAASSRRSERSIAVLDTLRQGFTVSDVVDISASESDGTFLEGTGVMVFDHANKLVYGSVSPRCDAELFATHAGSLGYEPVIFHTSDQSGVPIYHTNVLLGVQSTTAVLCAESIPDSAERNHVIASLEQTGHAVVMIRFDQLTHFCGNVLEVQNDRGEVFLVLSQTAYDGFTPAQRTLLGRDKTLLPVSIPTIESIGGGSARCMMAEVFLPLKD